MARALASGKAAVWRRRVRRFGRAGVSVLRFCELEGVSTPACYRWRRTLGEAGMAAPDADARSSADGDPGGVVGFTAVRVTAGEAVTAIALQSGARVEAPMRELEAVRFVVGKVLRQDAGLERGGSGC